MISFYGRHAMERNFQRTPVHHGKQAVRSSRGASSHQYNPAVILARPNTDEKSGGCYGMVFVYSGNFECEIEKDQLIRPGPSWGFRRHFSAIRWMKERPL